MSYLIFDIETRSECDLKRSGSWEYSVHPTTLAFCVSWCFAGFKHGLTEAPIKSWSPVFGGDKDELVEHLLNPDVVLVAHNALFEQNITKNVLSRVLKAPELKNLKPERFLCTASMAASMALPRSLEGACLALNLNVQKDVEGRKLILKYTKPRKASKHNPDKWHRKTSDLKRIIEYCEQDVRAEIELFLAIPELSETEKKVWFLDQKINQRGFFVDRELVKSALELIVVENANVQRKTQEISRGVIESTTQRDATLRWLKSNNLVLENLQAKTISEALLDTVKCFGDVREILQLRQAASKTSTAKFEAFEARSRSDSRCRDILIYHGASTGRWAGSGVQPQNFPRGTIKDLDTLVRAIKMRDVEWLRALYGEPMSALSSALRGCIIATPGSELYISDYNAIEARVLFWMAEHEDGIEAFRVGRDLYREMAGIIYRMEPSEIGKDSKERFLGKGVILGCGYGMGSAKFFETCRASNIPVTEELAQVAVKTYREIHAPVPKMWSNLERAAIAAVCNKDKSYALNKCTFFMQKDFLVCQLPSGRCLYYYQPEVRHKHTPWGEKRPQLWHYGSDSVTKQWRQQCTWGGVLTENVVQATARDLMATAMLKIEKAGFSILASVHDELIAERPKSQSVEIEEFNELMSSLPAWGAGCPVKAEGFKSERYRK